MNAANGFLGPMQQVLAIDVELSARRLHKPLGDR
jgi:hypothetical protein